MKIILTAFLLLGFAWGQTYTVGFAQDTIENNDWRAMQVMRVKQAASKYDFIDLQVTDAGGSIAKQIADIEKFIKKEVDFIITSPISAEITAKVLQKAVDKGIRVVLLSRGITTDAYTTFIRPDNTQIARQAASYMQSRLDEDATVLMLEGVSGTTVTAQRTQGFMEVIDKHDDITVISRSADFLRSEAIRVTEELMEQKVEFDAIYSHSDSMLEGVRKVLDKTKQKELLTVGIDYIAPAKQAIIEETQDASFTYPTAGAEGIEAIVKMIRGKKVPKDIIIDPVMVTRENVHEVEPIF
ncbi:MAG: substrate-binding domain-containing protein [Campylobacterota bacterium]